MLGKIIEYSVPPRFLLLLSALFLIVAGIYSIMDIPLDAIPDLSDVQVILFTEYS